MVDPEKKAKASATSPKYEALALEIALLATAMRLLVEAGDPTKMFDDIMAAIDNNLAALLTKDAKRKALLTELRIIAQDHLRQAFDRILSDRPSATQG